MIVAKHNHADLERLAQLLVDGELTPIIDTTYPSQERDAPSLAETPAETRHRLI